MSNKFFINNEKDLKEAVEKIKKENLVPLREPDLVLEDSRTLL